MELFGALGVDVFKVFGIRRSLILSRGGRVGGFERRLRGGRSVFIFRLFFRIRVVR